MRREWRGWGDRYDAYAAPAGLIVFLTAGLLFASGVGGWLTGFALGAGVMNVTSFTLRRTIGADGRRRSAPPDS